MKERKKERKEKKRKKERKKEKPCLEALHVEYPSAKAFTCILPVFSGS